MYKANVDNIYTWLSQPSSLRQFSWSSQEGAEKRKILLLFCSAGRIRWVASPSWCLHVSGLAFRALCAV